MTVSKTLSWLSAGFLAASFLATDIQIARNRLLWYDEIGTLELVKVPDFSEFWRAQNSFRGDSAPTTYLLLVRSFFAAAGHSESAVRLLSALGLAATFLVIFDCARRLSGGTHGLTAMCVLACSFLTYYGYEGRPYTLAVLFTSVALWLWLHTAEESLPAAVGFGTAIFAAVSMHFNSVLVMAPFGLWELWRWRPWNRPSRKFVAGTAGLLCALGIALHQIRIMHAVGAPAASSWSAPTLAGLTRVLGQMFPSGLLILAVFAILRCLAYTSAKPMADAERLCWLFLAIPFAGFILSEVLTKSFYNRYLIVALPGVAVAFACLVARQLRGLGAMVLLLMMLVLSAARQYRDLRGADDLEPPSAPYQQLQTRQALALEDAFLRDGKNFVIIGHTVVRALQYYSKHPGMYVSYGPNDAAYFCQYLGTACWNEQMTHAHAGELAAINPPGKLIEALIEQGYRPTIRRTNPFVVYFSRP